MNWVSLIGGDRAASLANLRFEFGSPFTLLTGILILLLVSVGLGLLYYRRLSNVKGTAKPGLLALRVFAWLLVAFLLLNPALVGEKFDPGQNYVLLLFDDSRSMRIPIKPGQSRGAALREQYAAASAEFEGVLQQRYAVARYAFGERTQRIESVDDLRFAQRETRIEEGVVKALKDFEGIAVAAVIVFSDGISQPSTTSVRRDEFGQVPVLTVAVGDAKAWKDLALGELQVSRSFGDGRPVRVKVNVHGTGLADQTAVVELLQENRVVATRTLQFNQDQETQSLRLEATPDEKGWLIYKARVRLDSQDADSVGVSRTDVDWVPENNQIRFLVDNRERKYRLFYFSGRPNWEHKFIQRAISEDPQFEWVSVLRISAAKRKFVYRGKRSSMVNPLFDGFDKALMDQPRYDESVFLRFGGDSELAGRGYPEDSKEMFTYDMMVMGDIKANFFAQSQLALTRDFVRKRGGSLLMLGGPFSFSEGGWRGTVLESVLPVMMSQPPSPEQRLDNLSRKFKVKPTLEGNLSGVWALNTNAEKDASLWEGLPDLAGLHGFTLTRVGSTVMARAETDSPGWQDTPVFASQRYGEGRTAIMATVATWPWTMHTDREDPRHGQIWRQLIRHLVADVPKPLQLIFDEENAVEGNVLDFKIQVRDEAFEPKSGARVSLVLLEPDGAEQALPVEEGLEEVGRYGSQWTPKQPGLHRLTMNVSDSEGRPLGTVESAFWAQVDDREFRQAASQPEALQRLAENHGGMAFGLNDLAKIPDRIPWTQAHLAETVRLPIWHFPGFFILLAIIWCLEWYWRRTKGHA